ncbi:monomethylamine:corrinoid methyltransferase [Clostridiaceae bacterium 35-E11]
MYLNIIELMDRAMNTGPKMEVRDFDMKVYKETTRLVKKYGIKFDKDNVVNMDDDMADRLFQAGKEFYLSMGTYTMETKRIIQFTEAEINKIMSELPKEIVIGQGKDQRIMRCRNVESSILPTIQGGVIGGKATENMLVPLYQSIAQEKLVDSFYFDPPHVIEGRPVMFGSPLEIYAARITAVKIREVLQKVGRSGMHLLGGAGSALADISTCWEGGIRQTDGICSHTTSELKTDLDALNKIMHTIQYDCCRQVWWAPVIGAFAGGAEGSAVAAVGGFFHAVLIGQAHLGAAYLDLQVTPYYNAGATDRMSLWILSAAGQAIVRNCNAILQGTITTSAGPGTKLMLYEIAASVLAQTVSGYHIFGVRIHKPTKDNHGTGLESRWAAEVSRAAVKLDRREVNDKINKLFERYESFIGKAPEGYSFEELYDVVRVTPSEEYLKIYEEVKKELYGLGIPFENMA